MQLTPVPFSLKWCLRCVVALQCAGAVACDKAGASPVFSFLWNDPETGGLGWSESTTVSTLQIASWALLLAIPLVLLRPCWPVLVPIALWQFANAAATAWMGGNFAANNGVGWLPLPAQAVRIAAPVALLLLDRWPRAKEPTASLGLFTSQTAEWLMRLAVACTFIAHGWEAYRHCPEFIDYLIMAAQKLAAYELSESHARQILSVIGVIDFVVGGAILLFRWRCLALYMAIWGAITAFSRVVHAGWPAYYEVLVRTANAGLPLALAIYWWHRSSTNDTNLSSLESSDAAT